MPKKASVDGAATLSAEKPSFTVSKMALTLLRRHLPQRPGRLTVVVIRVPPSPAPRVMVLIYDRRPLISKGSPSTRLSTLLRSKMSTDTPPLSSRANLLPLHYPPRLQEELRSLYSNQLYRKLLAVPELGVGAYQYQGKRHPLPAPISVAGHSACL